MDLLVRHYTLNWWRREPHYSLQPLPQADLDFIHFQDTNKYTNEFIGFYWTAIDATVHFWHKADIQMN